MQSLGILYGAPAAGPLEVSADACGSFLLLGVVLQGTPWPQDTVYRRNVTPRWPGQVMRTIIDRPAIIALTDVT
jgi:hypothetical protein